MINYMGKFASGDKPKFDLITASKTRKYKIVTSVVLILGLIFLGLGLLLKGGVTQAVIPNSLEISELSGLTQKNGELLCDISIDQSFIVNTGTVDGRALVEPITFTLMDGAEKFLVVCDATNTYQVSQDYYPGLYHLRIRSNAPEYINQNGSLVRPTGKLRITCGSYMKEITFTYYQV